VALQYECLVEESRRRDPGVDDVADLWAEVTPAPENESLKLAGDELRSMRRERHTKEGQS
jgi:hypothetical protein